MPATHKIPWKLTGDEIQEEVVSNKTAMDHLRKYSVSGGLTMFFLYAD